MRGMRVRGEEPEWWIVRSRMTVLFNCVVVGLRLNAWISAHFPMVSGTPFGLIYTLVVQMLRCQSSIYSASEPLWQPMLSLKLIARLVSSLTFEV